MKNEKSYYGLGATFLINGSDSEKRRLYTICGINYNKGFYDLICIEQCPERGEHIQGKICDVDQSGMEPLFIMPYDETNVINKDGIIKLVPNEDNRKKQPMLSKQKKLGVMYK